MVEIRGTKKEEAGHKLYNIANDLERKEDINTETHTVRLLPSKIVRVAVNWACFLSEDVAWLRTVLHDGHINLVLSCFEAMCSWKQLVMFQWIKSGIYSPFRRILYLSLKKL